MFQSFLCCLSVFSPQNLTCCISAATLMYNQQFCLVVTIQDSSKCLEHILAVSALKLSSTLDIFTISWRRHSSEAADSPASARQCEQKVQYWGRYQLILATYQSKEFLLTYRQGQIIFFSQKQCHIIFSKSLRAPP